MNRIKELRTEIKMSQKEFAKIFGIAQNTLSQYETGKREPDTGLLLKMSNYFCVTIDYLLGNSNIRNSETNLDNQKTLLPRLKQLRTEKGVSQQTIADYLGITRQSYTNYELGNREADYVTLTKLANYFETTVDYLIGNTDKKNPLPKGSGKYKEFLDKLDNMEADNLARINDYMDLLLKSQREDK